MERSDYVANCRYEKLSDADVLYWLRKAMADLKLAGEIEAVCMGRNEGYSPNAKHRISRELNPANNSSVDTGYGVNEVKNDGSLRSAGIGVEVTQIGLNIHDVPKIYRSYKKICDTIKANGGTSTSQCGGHIHMLLAYTERRPERNHQLPLIVYANVWQIVRKFAPVIRFLTKTNTMRGSSWGSYDLLMKKSAIKKNIKEIVNAQSGRYHYMNTKSWSHFGETVCDTFHIEFRVGDGNISPSLWTAFTVMYAAIFLKAIKLSKYGVYKTGDEEERDGNESLMRELYRINQQVDDGNIESVQAKAREFLMFLETEIRAIDKGLTLEVLGKVIRQPIFKQRVANIRLEEIYHGNYDRDELKVNIQATNSVLQFVHQNIVDETPQTKWRDRLASELSIEEAELRHITDSLNIRWRKETKTFFVGGV